MKKILSSIALLFLATMTFAATSVTIHNYTGYTVYFSLEYSSDPTNYCQNAGLSDVLNLTSGTSATYNFSSNVPSGVTATDGAFIAATPFAGNPDACSTSAVAYPVGNPCLGLHAYVSGAHFLNASCSTPLSANITWDYSDYANPVLTIQ